MNLSLDCSGQKEELSKYYISFNPEKEFSIPPKEKRDIEIRYHPKTRLHHFKKELFYKIVEN